MSGFDINGLLRDLHLASGMTVALYDAQFRTMQSYDVGKAYCTLLHDEPEAVELCLRSDLQGFHRVQQTGALHMYVCPFGFCTAIMPIRSSRKILGYLYIGGVLPREGGVEAAVSLVSSHLGAQAVSDRLRDCVGVLPTVTEQEFSALCTISRMLCEYIEQNDLFPTQEVTIGELTEKYILQNLHTKITLGKICLSLHCSKATLTESFKREYGVTVVQFITDQRLDRACHLLCDTPLSVRAVAEECGFSGMEYFSAQFKKRYGLSPLAFRKKQGGNRG